MPAPKDPKRAEELRLERIERNTGYRHTPEAIEKIRQANYTRTYKPHTEESKKRMSDSHRDKPSPRRITRYCQNCNAPYFGNKCKKYCSEECRKAARKPISEQHKARLMEGAARANANWTDERRARSSEVHKGKEIPQELRDRLSVMGKAFFESMSEEERAAYHTKRLSTQTTQNTSIEVFVAQWLDEYGVKYEQQKRVGYYFVDFYLTDIQLLLEVNGCWWHACEECGYNINEYSAHKQAKDKKRIAYLESKGYTVAVLWEHDLRPFMDKHEGT